MLLPNHLSRAILRRLALALAVGCLGFAAWSAQARWFGAHASPLLSGTKTIPGDYPTITAALADIQAQGLDGPLVLELGATYTSVAEVFPLTFTNLTGASATNTLTVRPASGATGLSITGTASPTINLDNANFVTIDGRPGGVGSAKELTIENTSDYGLQFINEASNNTIQYVTLRASSVGVFFGATTGANGNDNNTIDNCDIGDAASTLPIAVLSQGTTTTTAHFNSGNAVSNSNIFNFAPTIGSSSAGVHLNFGNTHWTITGNSFYQTASRAAINADARVIVIEGGGGAGNNFTITNNFIGGSAPNAGGTPWTTTGTTANYRFVGIDLSVGTTTPSSVQGNTIRNFVWTSASSASGVPGVWTGINVLVGSVNIGTVTGNNIGSGVGTDSISVTTSGSGGTTFGIAASSATVAISNNTIGSITTNGTTTGVSASITGITASGTGAITISNNTIGSTTTANSLNAATSSTGTGQSVTGITAQGSITNNTVANLNNNYAGTGAGSVRGIVTTSGGTITGNTVRNLSTTSQSTNAGLNQSVVGIAFSATAAGQTVSNNVVHSLVNTAATAAAVSVAGIRFQGPTSGTNVIARNLVHSLAVSSTSASSAINGLDISTGVFTAQNNMVRVGIDASGNSTAGASIVRGINDNGTTTGGRNFYHNSVYVGGAQTAGAANTFAFTSSGATNTRDFRNNIFVNARTNSGTATGKHYAAGYGGTGMNPTGLTSNNNIFLSCLTLGLYDGADRATLADWQAATGQDSASAFTDPKFVAPTAATPNLHLQAANPAEGQGVLLAAVTDDFDGETRSSLTPTDIGADAGNFTYAPNTPSCGGPTAPEINVKGNGVSINDGDPMPDVADHTDFESTAVSGGTVQRTFTIENTGTANLNVSGITVTGTNPGDFTVGALTPASPIPAGNSAMFTVTFDPSAAGARTATMNIANDDSNENPYDFAIQGTGTTPPTLSGTKTVCPSSCDYVNLTGAMGLFAAINNSTVTGDITANITGNLTEDGTNALNQWTESGAGNYTLKIQPADGTMKTISGAVANGMIRLNGARRVTIDGRSGGTGRFLTFRNTNTTNATITLLNDASNNTIRSSVIEGASTSFSNGVVHFSTGATTGNDNNLVTDNQIRGLSSVTVPNYLIYAQGTSTSVSNSNNSVAGNELYNFGLSAVAVNLNNDSWTISGNNIYEEATQPLSLAGIAINADGNNLVTQNNIHDLVSDGTVTTGISMQGSNGGNTTVSRNRIYNFTGGGAGNIIQQGIQFNAGTGSTINIVNNQITIIPSAANSQTIRALFDNGGSTDTFNAFYNSVLVGGTASGGNSWASLRNGSVASAHTARNNIFFNNRTGGTGNHFAAGNQSTAGTYSSNYNLFVGTGATAANFFDYGTAGAGTPVSFTQWKTSTGGDANSSAGNPGGNFTTAMFVNPAMGDLHIVAAGNPLVSNTGTPVTGITTDYDNDTRHATTPDLGSDEFGASGAPPTFTACPMNQMVNADANQCTASVAFIATATGTPAPTVTCKIGMLTITSPHNFPVGASNVVCTARNGTAPDATCSFTVTVTDNQNPTITAPADKTVNADANSCAATGVALGTPTFGDNCAGSSVSNNAPSSFPVGMTTVTWTVTDASGRTATATQKVTVTAHAAPSVGTYGNTNLAPGGNVTVTPAAAPTTNAAIMSVTAAASLNGSGGSFTGSFSGNTTTGALTINNANPPGVYTVTVTVKDNCGAMTTRTFTLTVNSAPTITAAMGVTRQQGNAATNSQVATALDAEDAETALAVTVDGAAMATTNGVTVSNLAVNASGQVTANVTASCTAINASFNLTVTDTLGATANATLNVMVTANAQPTVGTYPNTVVAPSGSTMVTPTAAPTDNGSIASVTATATPNNFSGTFSGNTMTGALTITNAGPMGGYSITVTVTDNCGASVTRTFMLTVSACGATLSKPDESFAGNGGSGSFTVTIDAGCPWTATNNAPGFITVTAPSATTTGSGTVSYNVSQNPVASRRSNTISVAGQTFTVLQGRDFLDVPQTHPFYTFIGKLSARAVTQGCDANNFCPEVAVTREQMAALISRALGVFNPPTPGSQRFADVPPANPFYAFIEEIAQRQVTLGCGGGNYCPSSSVTREQMAAFLIRALHAPGYVPPTPSAQRFLDVPPGNPFYAHIEELAMRQITLGCGGSNYCPAGVAARAQMAAFLVRALNL